MKHKIFNQEPYIFKLKNGLNVHLIPTNSHITYAQVDIPFGAYHLKYEKDNQVYNITPGSHHFLEHKMFATPDGDGFEQLINYGVSANALTTYRQTSYTLNGTTNVLDAIIYLIKLLENTYFTDKNVESELKIINEEIQMYDDDPDTKIIQKLHSQLLFNHPLTNDILGTKEDIKKITKETLRTLYEDFYLSDKRQLIIMGPIDISEYENKLKTNFDYETHTPNIKHLDIYEPNEVKVPFDTLYLDVNIPSFSFGLKYVLPLITEEILFKTEISMLFLMQMIFGNQTYFVEKLMKEGYITENFDMQIVMEDKLLIFMLDQTTKQPEILKELVYDEFFNNGLNQINEQTFLLLKRAYLGSYVMALDDIESKLYLYGKYHLNNTSLESAIKILEKLTLEDIYGLYHVFTKEMVSSLITLPNESNDMDF